ncbi:MAG: ATP-binding cassette domain-containing protein [Planctomycetes bacterium]|nr:ATP-binding cassette domain-containing protein [Planctomycetota bacterium]
MIELVGVTKVLGDRAVINRMNLEIRQGEVFVILGRSGAGKSVTLKLMVGLMRPDSGNVLVHGEDITKLLDRDVRQVRLKFGFVFQFGALINWLSVFENVALPLREHLRLSEEEIRTRVEQKLDLVQLTGEGSKMPAELSGGMKKRVGIARALIFEPLVILYDEPTTGLDPVRSNSIQEVIIDMNRRLGVTSVVVTHELHVAYRIANRIGFLSNGKIVEVGTPAEIQASKNEDLQNFLEGRQDEREERSLL